MVKTEAFPTIRMKIDRLLKITNEYQFNDLVKAVYCINLCINNRSVLESCLALNACLIEYEEKGSKRIGAYDEFKGFFGKIYDVMKPGIADDYTVEDFGEVQLRYNDKFYRVIIGTGHNNVYACLNFLPTLARNISREEELCLALEYVSGTIDYFIEENKNDGVVEKRFVLPTEILFYKVQKFFKEEVKKYDILELDSLMMSEGTTIEKSHFVCREDNIYPLYNVSLLIDLYDIWENKIDFKEQISVANEGIIDRIYSLFEMDRSRSCSIFAPAMIFPEQKYDSSQRTYTFIAKASRGVVVALNADEYEEGQLEKEIANIEKYHKSGTLHIAETFNRFDKSGLRGIHIPADMPIEYLIYDSFMNPNQMHMSLGEEGKKRKTCTALDVIYYLNFMDDIDELFEYLSYSNEKDYESSFGFGSDAALYFTWKNQGRYIAKGAIIFNMVDVGYDTENEAVVDYFKEELKDYPFHMRDYLFREPFSWKIEKRDFDTYEYTVKHGMGFGGIYLPLPQKNYVFLTNNVEFYKDVKDFGEYRQWIQLLEEIITEGFDSIKCVFEDNKAISNTGIQIAFMPIEYAVHAGHEIFAQYIEKLKQNNREYLETMLDTVTDFMIHSDNYDEISITDLEKAGITSGDIRKTVNSGILLSKKLVFHEGTIARNEKEVVYFVFDEMRDYCLARQILLNNVSAYYVDGESVIEKLKQLKASGASCAEGVIHYCYVFFKTDELVSKLEQTEKMCNSILDLYRIPEGGERKSYWSMRYREEFQNLGLRIILTSGLELTDFEITYIQDCLRKDPYEDGGMFFDTMLDGTLYGGIYNLDIYLGILFGLKNKDAILNTFHTISARNNMDDRFIPEDFIKYYNELSDSERKLQIQKIAELFLLCFKLHDKDKQEELEDFFYNLPTHDKVQNDMILEMRIACGLEVKDYE